MPNDEEKKPIQGKIRGKSRRAPSQKDTQAREQQLINMAMNLAQEQLLNGTATSQVITHFLKLGSESEVLQRQKVRHEIELLEAKVKQIESQAKMDELYSQALIAIRTYSGQDAGKSFMEDEEFYDDGY